MSVEISAPVFHVFNDFVAYLDAASVACVFWMNGFACEAMASYMRCGSTKFAFHTFRTKSSEQIVYDEKKRRHFLSL